MLPEVTYSLFCLHLFFLFIYIAFFSLSMKLIAGVYIVMKRDNFITGTEIRSTKP